jgi:hypothetical protein
VHANAPALPVHGTHHTTIVQMQEGLLQLIALAAAVVTVLSRLRLKSLNLFPCYNQASTVVGSLIYSFLP